MVGDLKNCEMIVFSTRVLWDGNLVDCFSFFLSVSGSDFQSVASGPIVETLPGNVLEKQSVKTHSIPPPSPITSETLGVGLNFFCFNQSSSDSSAG